MLPNAGRHVMYLDHYEDVPNSGLVCVLADLARVYHQSSRAACRNKGEKGGQSGTCWGYTTFHRFSVTVDIYVI